MISREQVNGYRFDEWSLARWMEKHVAGFRGPPTIEQFKGGQSNPTYRLLTPGEPMCCASSRPASF